MTCKKICIISIVLAFLLVILYSCHKNFLVENSSDQFSVAEAKEWYYASFKKSDEWQNSTTKGKQLPDWKHGTSIRIGTLEIVEFPLSKSKRSIAIPHHINTALSTQDAMEIAEGSLSRIYFIKNSTGNIAVRELDIVPTKDYLKSKRHDISGLQMGSKNNDFTGLIITKNWNDSTLVRHQLSGGKMKGRGTPPRGNKYLQLQSPNISTQKSADSSASSPKILSSIPGLKADMGGGMEGDCIQLVCIWEQDCQQVLMNDQWVDEFCGDWYNTGDCWQEDFCDEGGGGSECSPATEGCACELWGLGCGANQPPDSPEIPSDSKDPCSQLALAIAKYGQAVLSEQLNSLLQLSNPTGFEYGFLQNVSELSENAQYLITDRKTDYSQTSVNLRQYYTWDATVGYTIGQIHNHPDGTAASSTDIFDMYVHYVNLVNAGASESEINYFKSHTSVTIVTTERTFIFMVADWNAFANLYNNKTSHFDDGMMANIDYPDEYLKQLLKAFGTTLNTFSNQGESSNTNFHRIEYDQVSNNINTTECNN